MATVTRNFVLLPGFSLHVETGEFRLAWERFRARRRESAALRHLAHEDPRVLADLGISRAQVAFDADHVRAGMLPR
jgi:uncharacterized protein YjiS (DUF1127 family)